MIVLWYIVFLVHLIGCIAVVYLGCQLPWCGAPLPVWFLLGLLLVQMVTDLDVRCIVTNLENKIRRRMGWPEIHGFMEYYFFWWRKDSWWYKGK